MSATQKMSRYEESITWL